jgi:hypothetical protein
VPDVSRLRRLGFRPRTALLAGVRALAGQLGEAPEVPAVRPVFRVAQIPTPAGTLP